MKLGVQPHMSATSCWLWSNPGVVKLSPDLCIARDVLQSPHLFSLTLLSGFLHSCMKEEVLRAISLRNTDSELP